MNIQLLQELQPYSMQELQSFFSTNENELDGILKFLSLMNIIKRLSNDTSKVELEILLDVENIYDSNIELKNNMYVFKYVGIIIVKNICLIIYPKYVKNYKQDKNNNYKILKQIISVIRKYQSKEQKQGVGEDQDITNFNLLSMTLELITNYFEHGLYRNDQLIMEENGEGEIIWDKTINENTAYFSNGIPVYLDTFTVNQESNEQDYFRKLHAFVITDACNKVKDLLNIIDVSSVNISSDQENFFGNIEYIIYRLNQELSTQFVTYKQNILKLIKKYISQKNNRNVSKNILFVGTNNFNLVWEDVCADVIDNKLKTQLGFLSLPIPLRTNYNAKEKLIDLIEKPLWSLPNQTSSHTLKPDVVSIVKVKDVEEYKFIIFDAKYYNASLEPGKPPKAQPGIESITKQYLYQLAYKKFIDAHNIKFIRNCFLMPTEVDKVIDKGTVSMEMFNEFGLEKIQVRYVPAKWMYSHYLEGSKIDISMFKL